ncbi:MAG: metal-dependent hydrolase [Waterburya sp.]
MPSPIAHSVTGYAISYIWASRANLRAKLPRHWLPFLGVFVAVAADLDFIPQILTGDRYHHGLTHSITFAVAVALIVWGIAAYIHQHNRTFQLALLTLVLYSSHLALDLITQNSSGIQLFWPFSTELYQSSITIFPSTYWSEPLLQHPGHFIFIAFELGYTALLISGLRFVKIRKKQLRE